MVFEVTYRKRKDEGRSRQCCFLEKETQPDRNEVVEVLNQLSPGDYLEASIEIQICGDFDTQVLRNLEIPIYRLQSLIERHSAVLNA
jgi:hypothetical protein